MKNPIVHFEIPANDVRRARNFYERTFDWKFNKFEEGEYWIVYTSEVDKNRMPIRPGAINGGLTKRRMEGEPFLNYIFVESVDAIIPTILANGGTIVRPKQEISKEIGSFALFKDPEGNVMGIVEMGAREMPKKSKTQIKIEPGKQELFLTREVDAPRELVFKCSTDPKLFAQWVGPRGLTTTIEAFEPRPGGRYRYIQKDREGNEYAFHGVYHEVTPPERIIYTFEFEGLPEKGHVILETNKFDTLPGNRTRLSAQSVFLSVEDRDGMVGSGMEEGVNDSYERLDELLARLK